MKRLYIISNLVIIFLVVFSGSAFACDIRLELKDDSGSITSISPDKPVIIQRDQVYTLIVTFRPDHGNCLVPAGDTIFLADEEKWKTNKDYLPLQLLNSISWQEVSRGVYQTEIKFKAAKSGSWELEIIRECTKGGYDEFYVFKIQSS